VVRSLVVAHVAHVAHEAHEAHNRLAQRLAGQQRSCLRGVFVAQMDADKLAPARATNRAVGRSFSGRATPRLGQ
jgi:hypothetical protein